MKRKEVKNIKKLIILVCVFIVGLIGGGLLFANVQSQQDAKKETMKNFKKVYPLAVTDKLKECAEFYTKHFNFKVVFQEDWYVHLVHEESGVELAFLAPNVDNQPTELHPAFDGKGMVYSFEVKDAKSEFERLSAKEDIDIIFKLKDEVWGQKHFIIRDPAGIYVDVVQQPEQ